MLRQGDASFHGIRTYDRALLTSEGRGISTGRQYPAQGRGISRSDRPHRRQPGYAPEQPAHRTTSQTNHDEQTKPDYLLKVPQVKTRLPCRKPAGLGPVPTAWAQLAVPGGESLSLLVEKDGQWLTPVGAVDAQPGDVVAPALHFGAEMYLPTVSRNSPVPEALCLRLWPTCQRCMISDISILSTSLQAIAAPHNGAPQWSLIRRSECRNDSEYLS